MKVLHPKIWVITPKNQGFGFPWCLFIYFTASRWFFGTMKTYNIPKGGASGRREKGRFGLALPGRPRVNSWGGVSMVTGVVVSNMFFFSPYLSCFFLKMKGLANEEIILGGGNSNMLYFHPENSGNDLI